MKHNVLRRPLLNTAAVLIFFMTMLLISFANPELTGFGFIWLIILIFLRTLQWLIGMTLAVIFCLAFLLAIFFGAVAVGSPSASARMYSDFRRTLAGWIDEVQNSISNRFIASVK